MHHIMPRGSVLLHHQPECTARLLGLDILFSARVLEHELSLMHKGFGVLQAILNWHCNPDAQQLMW